MEKKFSEFANHLANLSAVPIKKYFRQNNNGQTQKQDDSPVTKGDKEAEEIMRNAIIKNFPDHGIIGEEFSNINEKARYKWVLDPIDGTISYVIGRPIFGTLIALTKDDVPILGIINQPINNERWFCAPGEKTLFNGQEISSNQDCHDLKDAIFATTSPYFFSGKTLEIINKISAQTKFQNQGGIIYGGDCYLFGLLALGKVDIIVENGLSTHDYAALVPVLKGAGAIVSDWNGKELTNNSDGTIVASANSILHKKIIEIISLKK